MAADDAPWKVVPGLLGLHTDVYTTGHQFVASFCDPLEAAAAVRAVNERAAMVAELRRALDHLREFKNTKEWHETRRRITGMGNEP